MKKVINITLGSIVFAIEQDSYEILAAYLEQIKSNLNTSDDATEIIDDIEHAIAEKFIARKRDEKNAVTVADVEAAMMEMGSPAEFGEGATTEQPQSETTTATQSVEPKKRLYRDSDNAVIAGVAAGFASYFSIDPVLVRLLFVISIFFNGLGILAYIILWFVVPVATTTADKYAMRGERVTLKDISQRVKKNLETIEQADYTATKGLWVRLRQVLDTVFSALGVVIRSVGVVARYVVGVGLVAGGALTMAAMVSTYSVILLSEKVFFPPEVQIALDTMQHNTLGIVAMVASFIMMAIVQLVVIMAGASLLAKRNFFTVQKTVLLAVVWIVAAVVAGTASVLQVELVMQELDRAGYASDYELHIDTNPRGDRYNDNDRLPQEEGIPSASPDTAQYELPVVEVIGTDN